MTIVTPNELYTTGTISLTNGSDVVTGDGTFWTAVALRGDALWIADRSLLVKEVLADDQIRIAAPWGGATVADQPYALSYSSWLRYSIAELQGGVRDVLAFWRMGGVRGTRAVSLPIDAITVDDLDKVVVYGSAAPVAVSIPQAAADGKLVDGWACWIKVTGAGAVTITPTVSTINGAASLALGQGDTAMLWSHGGNYLAAVLHVGEDGEDGDDGAPGATILVQGAMPATSYPPGSLWIDQDSADLDVHQLGGDPLAWTDTGVNLKGPQGDPGTDGTDGTDGADGVNGINGASALTVVRTAATANVNIASALENGDAVSGVTLATNDLVLLTAQTAPAENGVYVVAASGAAARHASFASYDAHAGCYFSVCEGTGVADTLWRCTSDRGGTIGSTALAFAKFGAAISASIQMITVSGTYTPSAGTIYAVIECIGGGGAGGGVAGAATTGIAAGGGGAGAYSRKAASAATIGASQAVTIGAGGAPGAAGANAGGNGGQTSVGTLCTAPGGGGGQGASSSTLTSGSGSGGAVGTGDLAVPGARGGRGSGTFIGPGYNILTNGGQGASSPFGSGGDIGIAFGGVSAGMAASGYGAGGGGAAAHNSTATAAGGAGAPGLVIITEYRLT